MDLTEEIRLEVVTDGIVSWVEQHGFISGMLVLVLPVVMIFMLFNSGMRRFFWAPIFLLFSAGLAAFGIAVMPALDWVGVVLFLMGVFGVVGVTRKITGVK